MSRPPRSSIPSLVAIGPILKIERSDWSETRMANWRHGKNHTGQISARSVDPKLRNGPGTSGASGAHLHPPGVRLSEFGEDPPRNGPNAAPVAFRGVPEGHMTGDAILTPSDPELHRNLAPVFLRVHRPQNCIGTCLPCSPMYTGPRIALEPTCQWLLRG